MALCGHDIVGDDPRSPLDFHLCGRLGCRGGGLAFVPVRLCRTRFHALNERKPDAAAAHSKLVAVDRGVRLRRHCSGRRAGSHWLDCTGTIGVLVFPPAIKRTCAPPCIRHLRRPVTGADLHGVPDRVRAPH